MKRFTAPAAACALGLLYGTPAAAATTDPGMWSIDALLPLGDGSLVIGGSFDVEDVGGSLFVERLRADGRQDTRFTSAVITSDSPWFDSISALPDGRLILAAPDTFEQGDSDLVALRADGRIDPVLTRAFAGLNAQVEAVAVQPDGKVLLGGGFTRFGEERCPYLVRLNPDGTRDEMFDAGGAGPNWPVNAIAVDPSGKIVVGGRFFGYTGQAVGPLVRLDPDGRLDPSFVADPQVNQVRHLALRPDGGVVLSGSRWSPEAVIDEGLMALRSDGARDNAFEFSQGWDFSDISVQQDFKTLMVIDQTVVRLMPDGRLDMDFFRGSMWQFGGAEAVTSLADGSVVFGSSSIWMPRGSPVLAGMYADGRQDKRWSRPGTFANPRRAPARPSGVKARWVRDGLWMRWDVGRGQVAYAVRFNDGKLWRSSAVTVGRSATVRLGRRKDGRACVRAYNPSGSSRPTCVMVTRSG